MELRKYRWSKVYESAEEELVQLLATKHIQAERWEAEPGEIITARMLAKDSRLWCAEGSLALTIDGKRFSLQPGDTLDIPAYQVHEGIAGFGGCACYQSPVSADNPPLPAA